MAYCISLTESASTPPRFIGIKMTENITTARKAENRFMIFK